MIPPAARSVFVYGSCVSRDAFGPAVSSEFKVVDYVARQSLISAFLGPPAGKAELTSIASPFQRRMVEGDLGGDLAEHLLESTEIDVLLWDLVDERMGVHLVKGGAYVTNSAEFAGVASEAGLETVRHIAFGSDEHFDLFRRAALKFRDFLKERELFRRTLLIYTPFSSDIENGVDDDDLQARLDDQARDLSSKVGRYVHHLSRYLGFRLVSLPRSRVQVDAAHQWGPASFHFAAPVYELMRETIRSIAPEVEPPVALNHSSGIPTFDWEGMEEFVGAESVQDGEHFISLGDLKLPLYIHGVGNLRCDQRLPVFFSDGSSEAPLGDRATFVGMRTAGDLGTPFVSVGDPSASLRPFSPLTWYAGNQWVNVPDAIHEALRSLSTRFEASLLLVGGGVGGFAGLKFASMLGDRAAALVWSPQTSILRASQASVHGFLAAAFPTEYCYRGSSVSEAAWSSALSALGVDYDLCAPDTVSRLTNVLFLQDWNDGPVVENPFSEMTACLIGAKGVSCGPCEMVCVTSSWGDGRVLPPYASLRRALSVFLSRDSGARRAAEAFMEGDSQGEFHVQSSGMRL